MDDSSNCVFPPKDNLCSYASNHFAGAIRQIPHRSDDCRGVEVSATACNSSDGANPAGFRAVIVVDDGRGTALAHVQEDSYLRVRNFDFQSSRLHVCLNILV